MGDGLSRRLKRLQRQLARGMDAHDAALQLDDLAATITDSLTSAERRRADLVRLLSEVLALRDVALAEGLTDIVRERLARARAVVSVAGPRISGYAAMDASGGRDADGALHSTVAHLAQLQGQVRDLLLAKGDDASPELQDLAVSLEPASAAARAAQVEAQWSRTGSRRADVGHSVARVGRCAVEALRADAALPAPPAGVPVQDVPTSLLWLIADLSVALRRAGRIGPHARRHDAGVAARDAADLVVTTFRRWRPRLRGADAEGIASMAATAGYAAAWAGLSTIVPNDDDAAGVHAKLHQRPPGLEGSARVLWPTPDDVEPVRVNLAALGTVTPEAGA